MQPNNLPVDHVPHGVQENSHLVVNITSPDLLDVFTIPSDWSFYILYSYNIFENEWKSPGSLKIRTWLEPYFLGLEGVKDYAMLNSGFWDPTNNYLPEDSIIKSDSENEFESELEEAMAQEIENNEIDIG